MREKIVAANWKMHTTFTEGLELVNELQRLHDCRHNHQDLTVILCPPFSHLQGIAARLNDCCIKLGAQNLHQEEKGAYTGEISAEMLRSVGCSYVIIGHSERRQYFGEDNTLLAKKVRIALSHDLLPIFCCGETLHEREDNIHFDVIRQQITEGLFHLNANEITDIIIAYEPVWAIGTGKTASPEQAQEVHRFIRSLISEKYNDQTAEKISILYGGSIKAANAKEIFSQKDIDGGLVGGASLNAAEFNTIINATA